MPKLIITKINPLRLLLFNFLHGYCSGISIEKKYFMKFKRGHMYSGPFLNIILGFSNVNPHIQIINKK